MEGSKGDSDHPEDQCAVVGVSLTAGDAASDNVPDIGVIRTFAKSNNAPYIIYKALGSLQHRGQSSAGIATLREGRIELQRVLGLVEPVDKWELAKLESDIGIGHTRYCTAGSAELCDSQPIKVRFGNGRYILAGAFNGNLVNLQEAREAVDPEYEFKGTADGEVLFALLAGYLRDGCTEEEALTRLNKQVEGAYSLAFVQPNGTLTAHRDPLGLRPLSIGVGENGVMFASESKALTDCGFDYSRNVKPGEMVVVGKEHHIIASKQIGPVLAPRHCMFEYVYISMPETILDEKSVYGVRYRCGEELARTTPTSASVIVPVPETSRAAAEGVSAVTGLPIVTGLRRNPFVVDRSFMNPTQEKREDAVNKKLVPVPAAVAGERLLVIDDSLVRGTTMRKIVSSLREAGAKSVEVWIASPPIVSPCFYGVDMPNHSQLSAAKMTEGEICVQIGANALHYLTEEQLVHAIGLGDRICKGCITGKYPTPKAQQLADSLRTVPTEGRYTEQGMKQPPAQPEAVTPPVRRPEPLAEPQILSSDISSGPLRFARQVGGTLRSRAPSF